MSDLDDLKRKYGMAGGDADDLADLRAKYKPAAPAGPGPLRDNPTFSTAPPEAPAPGVPRLPPIESLPQQATPAQTFGRNVVQGMTGGFADEVGAILGTAVEKGLVPSSEATEFGGVPDLAPSTNEPQARANESTGDTYRRLRDSDRAMDRQMNAANPNAALGGSIFGAAVSPLSKLGGGAKTVAGRVAAGAAQGAVYGAGGSEADATKGEVMPLLRDTGISGAVGGGAALVGEGAKALVQKGKQVFSLPKDELRTRVLNEVAEGTAKTTPTARKHLEKAGDAILKEVVDGPEGDAIRAAYSGGAKKGAAKVMDVANRVTSENNAAYAAFDAAGKSTVDVTKYRVGLQTVADKARAAGKSMVADAIERYGDDVVSEAGKNPRGLTLTQLRGLTTQAQTKAASALGSLNEHQAAKIGNAVVREITPAMKDVITDLAGNDPGLKKAAATIAANNQRLRALLTIGKGLEQRVYKESSVATPIVRAARSVASAAALPAAFAAGGALSSEDKVEGAIKGAAVGAGLRYGIPKAAEALSRARTGLAIDAARTVAPTPGPGRQLMTEFAGAIGRIGGRKVAGKREEDRQ